MIGEERLTKSGSSSRVSAGNTHAIGLTVVVTEGDRSLHEVEMSSEHPAKMSVGKLIPEEELDA